MIEFIKTQYKLHKTGNKSISIEKIEQLADLYMTEEQKEELFQ